MNKEFPVQRIAVPDKNLAKRGNRKYPWDELEVGDSFFVASGHRTVNQRQRQLIACSQGWINQFVSRKHVRFTTRIVEEDGVSGVRIWRVADIPVQIDTELNGELAAD